MGHTYFFLGGGCSIESGSFYLFIKIRYRPSHSQNDSGWLQVTISETICHPATFHVPFWLHGFLLFSLSVCVCVFIYSISQYKSFTLYYLISNIITLSIQSLIHEHCLSMNKNRYVKNNQFIINASLFKNRTQQKQHQQNACLLAK